MRSKKATRLLSTRFYPSLSRRHIALNGIAQVALHACISGAICNLSAMLLSISQKTSSQTLERAVLNQFRSIASEDEGELANNGNLCSPWGERHVYSFLRNLTGNGRKKHSSRTITWCWFRSMKKAVRINFIPIACQPHRPSDADDVFNAMSWSYQCFSHYPSPPPVL